MIVTCQKCHRKVDRENAIRKAYPKGAHYWCLDCEQTKVRRSAPSGETVKCIRCGSFYPRSEMKQDRQHHYYGCPNCRKLQAEIKQFRNEKKKRDDSSALIRKLDRIRPTIFPITREEFFERFQFDVDENGCWVNVRGRRIRLEPRTGYMRFKNQYLHRLVLELWTLWRPHESQVLHSCDNPACVNPDHLSWGTRSDNTQDMLAKGRGGYSPKKLTLDQVVEIRKSDASSYKLGPMYGVSPTQIRRIRNHTRW